MFESQKLIRKVINKMTLMDFYFVLKLMFFVILVVSNIPPTNALSLDSTSVKNMAGAGFSLKYPKLTTPRSPNIPAP